MKYTLHRPVHVVGGLLNVLFVVSNHGLSLWHDNAGCHKARETQKMLKDEKIEFFPVAGREGGVPGCSADCNVAEEMGATIMEEVEKRLDALEGDPCNVKQHILRRELTAVLEKYEKDSELLTQFVSSFKL